MAIENATQDQDLTAALIANVLRRKADTRWGIGTAAQYLKSVDGCPVDGFGVSAADWQKALKEAEGRLTWCDEEMADANTIAKSVRDSGLPDGFCAAFDCTLTSKRVDRDGDVLEPKGMVVDQDMPLLWQHLPMQPVGRMVKMLTQDDDRIRVGFGIVDTKFGRDVATLVKAGCLRMSHGFKPFEFEPITRDKSDDNYDPSVPVSGWHVKRGEVREGSVVSIPSNVDGIIEAYHGGELKTPLLQSWAKAVSDGRPVIVPVNIEFKVNKETGVIEAKAVNGEKGEKKEKSGDGDFELPEVEPAKDKTADPANQSDSSDQKSIANPDKKQAETTDAASPESAGEPDGDASGVVDHGEKSDSLDDAPDTEKAGKVLSARNMKKLTDARDLISAVCDSAMKEEEAKVAGKGSGVGEVKSEVKSDKACGDLLAKMAGTEDYVEGSYEWVQDHLNKTAADYLRSQGKSMPRERHDSHVWLMATMPDMGVIGVYVYDTSSTTGYRIAWTSGDDGKPKWTGDVVEVEVKPQVVDKMEKAALAVKASLKANAGPKTAKAANDAKAVGDADEIPSEILESPGATFSQAFANLAEKSLDDQVQALAALKITVISSLDRLEQQQLAYLYAAE